MVQKCLAQETKWCAHIKIGYQKCKVVTSTARRGMSSIQVVTLNDYFLRNLCLYGEPCLNSFHLKTDMKTSVDHP